MLDFEVREFLTQPVGLEVREQLVQARDVKGASVLTGIATVFCKSHLHAITLEHGTRGRRVAPRDHAEAKHVLVEGHRCRNIRHGQVHGVPLIAEHFLERARFC
jgi:hypothetical protein